MRYFLLLFLAFSFSLATCQVTGISGKIIDKESNEPLSFATIEIKNLHTGTIADENGQFHLTVDSEKPEAGTIEFMHLGCKRTKMAVSEFLASGNKVIALDTEPITIGEVSARPEKYKTVEPGVKSQRPDSSKSQTSVIIGYINAMIKTEINFPAN